MSIRHLIASSWLAAVLTIATTPWAWAQSFVSEEEENDPAYWLGRMEQALLPESRLRARLVLEPGQPAGTPGEVHMRLIRVQGVERIRSLVAIESPERERRVIRLTSTASGRLEKLVVEPGHDTRTLTVERSDRFLDSAFTYVDLGFTPLGHRAQDARVERTRYGAREVIEVESKVESKVDRQVDGAWARVVTRLVPKTALPVAVSFYDDAGRMIRTVRYLKHDHRGEWPFPSVIEVEDRTTGRSSEIRFESFAPGAEILEDEFERPSLDELVDELGAPPTLDAW